MPIRRTSNRSSQDTGFYTPEVYSDVGSRNTDAPVIVVAESNGYWNDWSDWNWSSQEPFLFVEDVTTDDDVGFAACLYWNYILYTDWR